MKPNKKATWFKTALFISVTITVVACKDTNRRHPDASLRFAQLPITYSAVTFIADAKGFYKREGLDYVSFSVPAGPDVVTSLRAKSSARADAGGIAITPVATMIGGGNEPVLLATTMTSDTQTKLVTFTATGITNDPATLKGKRIGVTYYTNGDVYLSRLLAKGGLTRKDVLIVGNKPADVRNSLVQGSIDAAILWDPFVVQVGRDYKALVAAGKTKDRGSVQVFVDPPLYTLAFNIVTTRSALASKRDSLVKMLQGTIMASEFIRKNPQETQRMLEQWLGLQMGDLDNFMQTTDFHVYLDVPKVKLWMTGELTWLKQMKSDTNVPTDLNPYIDSSLLKAVDNARVHE